MINQHEVVCDVHGVRHLPHQFKRISWSAVIMGGLIGVGLGFLLNLFGLAIGLTIFTLDSAGAEIMTYGGLLGMIVGIVASMLTAGYVSGYLGRLYCPQRNLGFMYGFATWSVALIISAAVAVQMSSYVVSYGQAISHSMYTVATTKMKAPEVKVTTEAAANKNKPVPMVHSKESCVAFTLFVLFFIGAFSSCVGGHWGMSCKRDD